MEQSIDYLHISVLSNNKLHCKVCSPNFYCFKFFFCISPLHNRPLPVSTNHRLPESRKKLLLFWWLSKIIKLLKFFVKRKNGKRIISYKKFYKTWTFSSLINLESVVLTIFPDFLTKLKYPPSQIASQCISPEIIDLKDSIGVDEKVQQDLSHFDRQTHPKAQPYNLLGLPQFRKEAKQLKD